MQYSESGAKLLSALLSREALHPLATVYTLESGYYIFNMLYNIALCLLHAHTRLCFETDSRDFCGVAIWIENVCDLTTLSYGTWIHYI